MPQQEAADAPALSVVRTGVLFLPECYDLLGGDRAAALMLSQILYWYTPSRGGQVKLRVEREGFMWLVKSHRDWYEECRLTRREVNRSIKKLRDQKIIETFVSGFKGQRATFIRLIRLDLVDGPIAPHGAKPGDHCTVQCIDGVALHPTVHSNTETTLTKTNLCIKGAAMKINGGKPGEESEQVKKALLEKINATKKIPPEQVESKASALQSKWCEWMKERYPELPLAPAFSYKERAQFSMLAKKLGAQPGVLMRWAIFNWEAFKARVKADYGETVKANYPVVGLVLLYREAARRGHAASVQLTAQEQVVHSAAPIPSKKEKQDKATPEDIAALLKEHD